MINFSKKDQINYWNFLSQFFLSYTSSIEHGILLKIIFNSFSKLSHFYFVRIFFPWSCGAHKHMICREYANLLKDELAKIAKLDEDHEHVICQCTKKWKSNMNMNWGLQIRGIFSRGVKAVWLLLLHGDWWDCFTYHIRELPDRNLLRHRNYSV